MANKTSQHILGTSSNLLGICLFIITTLHLTDKTENTIIDELTSVIALLLTIASVLSFLSLRTDDLKKESRLELTADYIFLAALMGILGVIAFIILNFWGK